MQPSNGNSKLLLAASFLLPLLIWSSVSYLPFLWHPNVQITKPGDVSYFRAEMQVERATFDSEVHCIGRGSTARFQS